MSEEGVLEGRVTAFDAERGLGQVTADGATYRFHCVEIADGTRHVEVGAVVTFAALPKLGRVEAATIRPR
ncbi:MAG: hypothetical protein WD225_02600 [Ilumatobacteraceae bacterium]